MGNVSSIARRIFIQMVRAAIGIVANAMANAKRNVCRDPSTALRQRSDTAAAHTSPALCGSKFGVKADVSIDSVNLDGVWAVQLT